ncbi:MAG: X-Pro dipeptidase [Rhodospirillaceae bacterium BRH_c57]|nr:MAG: X-Pro dipeptidase [Rhodospirillaceae bacterium BRH_c57]
MEQPITGLPSVGIDVPGQDFELAEYLRRVDETKRAMERAGFDLLVISDPSNMSWLTGYDAWSFYVHQAVVLPLGDDPIWFGREMDVSGARRTIWMDASRVEAYPDSYVHAADRHPMDVLAALIRQKGWSRRTIGVEKDNHYFTAACLESLVRGLPVASFRDAEGLVNWRRAVKSPAEIDRMRKAGRIVEAMHARIREVVAPGVTKSEVVAEIYRAGIRGVDGAPGTYPAIVPLLPSGAAASAPHLTWDETAFCHGEATYFEIAGCYRRYHCPLARTIHLGRPSDQFRHAEEALLAGIEAGIAAAKPGNLCEDVEAAFRDQLARFGMEKTSRCGYSIGLSYPPDWGERTMSLRPGDRTVLEENMCFHFMPGLWFADWGIEITESLRVAPGGGETLANVPREVLVRD